MSDHQKAQRWINAQVDGALQAKDALELEQHLRKCAACRQYADQIRRLDDDLQQTFAVRRQSEQRHSLPVVTLPPRAGSPIMQMRAPMNRMNLLSGFFRTVIYIAALAGLTGGLFFLFSTQFRPPMPGALQPAGTTTPYPAYPAATEAAAYPNTGETEAYPGVSAYPGSTAGAPYPPASSLPYPGAQAAYPAAQTPYPTPQAAYPGAEATVTPVYPPGDIADTLEDLAQKSAAWYNQPGWLYSLESDLQEADNSPVSSIETWYYAPERDGECAQSLTLVKDQPQGQTLYQMFVVMPQGLAGDLVQLRQGLAQVIHLNPGAEGCLMTTGQTPAGALAQRVAETPSTQGTARSGIREARIWTNEYDGRTALFVETIFEDTVSTPPVMIETRVFDPENGLLLEERIRQEWKDGRLFSQTAIKHTYQVLEELPAEIDQQLAQASQELQDLDRSSARPTAIPPEETPGPGALPDLDNLPPYTATSPLIDVDETVRLLQALRQRNLAWLGQAGWHLAGPGSIAGSKMQGPYTLLNVDNQGQCEQIVYFEESGQLSAVEIRLADGTWATKPVKDRVFSMGGRNGQPCSLQTIESVERLNNTMDTLRGLVGINTERTIRVWIQELAGQNVLTVARDEVYAGSAPTVIDPDTQSLEPLQHQIEILYFDLQTGNLLSEETASYLTTGKVIHHAQQQPAMRQYQLLSELPAALTTFYQETLRALQAYLVKPSL